MGKPGGEGTGPAWAQGVDGPTVCRSLRASAAADLGGAGGLRGAKLMCASDRLCPKRAILIAGLSFLCSPVLGQQLCKARLLKHPPWRGVPLRAHEQDNYAVINASFG